MAVGNVMLLLFGAIAIAMWYFTSLFLQNVLGYSALGAGLGQTPAAVMFVVLARADAAALPRTGVRPLLLAGCGCFLAGFGWLAHAGAGSSYLASMLGLTLLIAVGIGLAFPTLMAAATADVPEGDAGIIGGLANTASQVGGSVGLAVLATAANARSGMEASGGSPVAIAAGYDRVFLIAGGLGLAIAVVSLLVRQPPAAAGPRSHAATNVRQRKHRSARQEPVAACPGGQRTHDAGSDDLRGAHRWLISSEPGCSARRARSVETVTAEARPANAPVTARSLRA